MNRQSSRAALACMITFLAAASVSAQGNKISTRYSVSPDLFAPDAEAGFVACVTNVNPGSSRNIEPGDEFLFLFDEGLGALDAETGVCEDGLTVRSDLLTEVPRVHRRAFCVSPAPSGAGMFRFGQGGLGGTVSPPRLSGFTDESASSCASS